MYNVRRAGTADFIVPTQFDWLRLRSLGCRFHCSDAVLSCLGLVLGACQQLAWQLAQLVWAATERGPSLLSYVAATERGPSLLSYVAATERGPSLLSYVAATERGPSLLSYVAATERGPSLLGYVAATERGPSLLGYVAAPERGPSLLGFLCARAGPKLVELCCGAQACWAFCGAPSGAQACWAF